MMSLSYNTTNGHLCVQWKGLLISTIMHASFVPQYILFIYYYLCGLFVMMAYSYNYQREKKKKGQLHIQTKLQATDLNPNLDFQDPPHSQTP